jgi:hypothetical protein
MAVKTFMLAAGNDGNFAALVDGVDQAAASRTDGWTVGKIATGNFSDFDVGVKQLTTTFATTPLKPTALLTGATANAFKAPAPLTGTFANTNWVLSLALRATVASAQTCSSRFRIYKSVNADGSGAVEITPAATPQGGSTTAVLSTTADGTSTGTWSPGATVTLSNEYLFIALALCTNTAGGGNTADAVLRTGQASAGTRLVTPDFTVSSSPQNVSASGKTSAQAFGTIAIGKGPVSVAVPGCYPPGFIPSITGAVISGA